MTHAIKLSALALVLFIGNAMSAESITIPVWVPVFPDVKLELIEHKKTDKMDSVTFAFNTTKSPIEVRDFYKKGFAKAGFEEAKMVGQSIDEPEDGVKQENLKADDGKRVWFISARTDKVLKGTQVSLVYQTKG
jgi:hypothetical protein